MKKSLCIILAMAMLLFSFAACGKKDDEDPTKDSGEILIDTGADGDTGADSPNSSDGDSQNNKTNKSDKTNKNNTTSQNTSSPLDSLANMPQVDNFNPNASKDDLLADGTSAKKTTLREDIIGNALENRKFTISTVIVGEDGEMPATITMSGNNIATELTISGMNAKMIIQNGKTYVAFSSPSKFYFELEDAAFDMSDIAPSTEKQTYIGTTTVKDGNKTYICEEYKSGNGKVKYYFLDNKWVRYELIDGDITNILEVENFKGSADNSMFDLTGYTKFDMNALAGSSSTGIKK